MRLRVESDGTSQGTEVIAEDGTRITNVTAVRWGLDAGGLGRVTLELQDVEVKVHQLPRARAGEVPPS